MRLNSAILLLVLFLSSSSRSLAEIKWVEIGVNGLTCSLCSRSVEMSLRRLDFVDNVSMSLEKTEGRIYLKPNLPVNLKQIATAVSNAGFSVRFLRIQFDMNDIDVNNNGAFTYLGQTYQWLDFKGKLANTLVALKVVDEHFLPKKESAEWKKKMVNSDQKVLHVVQEG
jgi:cation transport ATPase